MKKGFACFRKMFEMKRCVLICFWFVQKNALNIFRNLFYTNILLSPTPTPAHTFSTSSFGKTYIALLDMNSAFGYKVIFLGKQDPVFLFVFFLFKKKRF